LVLELRLPEIDTTHLAEALQAMLPRLYIYLIAFYSIANHWVVHQRMFRHITDMDTNMLWLTIAGLLFITLIPAATAIVGRFPGEKLAVACFSANSFPGSDRLALLVVCHKEAKEVCQSFRPSFTCDHCPGLADHCHWLACFHPPEFHECLCGLCGLDRMAQSGRHMGKSQTPRALSSQARKVG
jgi:hypothetical protein